MDGAGERTATPGAGRGTPADASARRVAWLGAALVAVLLLAALLAAWQLRELARQQARLALQAQAAALAAHAAEVMSAAGFVLQGIA